MGVGYIAAASRSIYRYFRFNRGGDSWGWATATISVFTMRITSFNRGGDSWGWATQNAGLGVTVVNVSIAGAILGGGLRRFWSCPLGCRPGFNRGGDSWGWATNNAVIGIISNFVSIAGAILGGGLRFGASWYQSLHKVSIAGAILGGGLLAIDALFKLIVFCFNRGGDSWGWATLRR